jgi:hypothetical protein
LIEDILMGLCVGKTVLKHSFWLAGWHTPLPSHCCPFPARFASPFPMFRLSVQGRQRHTKAFLTVNLRVVIRVNMNITDDFKLTVKEVASLLNRKPNSILHLIKSKKLIAEKRLYSRKDKFKCSRKYFVSEKSVEKYFDTLNPLTLKNGVCSPFFAKKKIEVAKAKANHEVAKSTANYIDKIKKVHNLVNEFGGLDSFKKTFKLYCIYRDLFVKG